MLWGAHVPELIVVIVVALLVFGPKKLPELGSSVGKTIKEFQKGIREVAEPIKEAVAEPLQEVRSGLRLPAPAGPTSTASPPDGELPPASGGEVGTVGRDMQLGT